jgi:hypothetical protein
VTKLGTCLGRFEYGISLAVRVISSDTPPPLMLII